MSKKENNTDKPRIISWHNYPGSKPEYNSGEVTVVPDDALSIPEIFERFRRGIPLPIQKEGVYQDDPDFDDIDGRQLVKDYADVTEIAQGVNLRRFNRLSEKKPVVEAKKASDEGTSEKEPKKQAEKEPV